MNQIYKILLKEQLKIHEGLKLKPYRCTSDKLTIGIGRNLEDKGITKEEAEYLLFNDIDYFEKQCKEKLNWFDKLSDTRKCVIIELAFNVGIGNVKRFKRMINNINNKKWKEASEELLNSRYARQVGNRANILAKELETDVYEIKEKH